MSSFRRRVSGGRVPRRWTIFVIFRKKIALLMPLHLNDISFVCRLV